MVFVQEFLLVSYHTCTKEQDLLEIMSDEFLKQVQYVGAGMIIIM
jgi:hypothetical protein